MPDPAGINPLVGRVAPPPEVPSFNDAVVTQNNYDTAQAIRKQRVDAAMDQAATQSALQQAQGDIPTALDILAKSGRTNALGALQKGWDDHQQRAQVLAKEHLDMVAAQHELAADWAHALIGHPERFAAAKQALTPEASALLGDQYDEGRLQAIADSSKQGAQWNKDAAAAVTQAPKTLDDAVRFAAGHAANAPDQSTWDSIPAYYDNLGMKQIGAQIRQQLGPFSPENKARAATMALTPEQQQQAPLQAAQTAKAKAEAAAEPIKAQTELVKAQTAQRAAVPQLTPGAIQRAAAAFRLLGQQSIPTRIGEADRVAIMNASDEQAKVIGQSPVQTIQRQLALKADGPALALVRKQEAGTVAAESKALKQIDLIKGISPTVARTDWPIINQGVLSFKEATGDTPAIKLQNAITTFASEYGKIIEGSTGSVAGASDSARGAAARLISAAQGKDTLNAVIEQMKTEMQYAKEGWGASADAIITRMGGGEGAAAPASGVNAKDPLGILGGRGGGPG